MMKKVVLQNGKDISLRRLHPWVFSGAIKFKDSGIKEGEPVQVCTVKSEIIGTGHYHSGSIAVRMLTFRDEELNIAFWEKKIRNAYEYRLQAGLINNPDTNVYRLVFAEGDGLPGLIIDIYDDVAVMQSHTIGMYLVREEILQALNTVYGDKLKAVYDKSAETLAHGQVSEITNSYLKGEKNTETIVKENKHQFLIDWETGQKTGFFIDQRENRKLLSTYSSGKKVLNTFCYTGGFSVYALGAGAELVHSVDSSKKAMELTDRNVALNKYQNHESFTADVFDFIKDKHDFYDIIVLDPPAFAKSLKVRHNALMGYKRLNFEAIKRIKKSGLIFTFSCSQVVDKSLFQHTITAAAIEAGRNIRVMHQMNQPADHPFSIFHPEGEYLKGLVIQVD